MIPGWWLAQCSGSCLGQSHTIAGCLGLSPSFTAASGKLQMPMNTAGDGPSGWLLIPM